MSQAVAHVIDKFLGVNKSETETLLQLGEASNMSNWMITDDLKLKKQYGYKHLNNATGTDINGIWYGKLNGTNYMLFARGGHVYNHNLTTHADTDLGAIIDSNPTMFFMSNNTVYIIDGTDMYSWSGTGSIATVPGYVPTVFTAAPPTGGGTILEGINYLTGQKSMKFSSKTGVTVYQLPELNITSLDSLVVNGVTLTVGTNYTVNLTNGTFTLVSPVSDGVNNVVPTWTKTVTGDRQTITKNKYYGGTYYARFWIFGNPDHKNTRYCSSVTIAGVSDPTYWAKFTDSDVGEFEITDIKTQYDKQIIWTSGDSSGASAWYSLSETFTDPNTGLIQTLFPVFPINAKVGNVAKGQVQIITNNPFSIWKGVYEWQPTNVINEKNAVWISKRIQADLDEVDLTKAITWDWDDKGLYLLCVGSRIWIFNYRVNAWYVLDLPHTPTCFISVEAELYFGTTTGQIMKFEESLTTYDGEIITAEWEMGYYNFGVDWLQKFIQIIYFGMLPFTQTHIDIYVSTDRKAAYQFIKTIEYALSNFSTWNFSNYSFATNYSPQPKKVKLRAKKIDYLKLKLVSSGTDTAVALSITLPTRTGGEVKGR